MPFRASDFPIGYIFTFLISSHVMGS